MHGHLTHSWKAVYPQLIRSMQLGGSILHRRQWARVTCQRKMPGCFRLALRMDHFPTMHQCKKRHAELAEKNKENKTKQNQEEKLHMPCSHPGSLPHAAASSTRLEFKESQQRQLFGPSNIGLHLAFPREGARTDPHLAFLCSARTCPGLCSEERYQKQATR